MYNVIILISLEEKKNWKVQIFGNNYPNLCIALAYLLECVKYVPDSKLKITYMKSKYKIEIDQRRRL